MNNLLTETIQGGDVMVTLCNGKIDVLFPEVRPKIIAEYTRPRLQDQVTEFIRS